jgi:hypothetical protein
MRRNKHKNTPTLFSILKIGYRQPILGKPKRNSIWRVNNSCLVQGLVTVTATRLRNLSVRLLAVEHAAIQLQWRLLLTAVQFEEKSDSIGNSPAVLAPKHTRPRSW